MAFFIMVMGFWVLAAPDFFLDDETMEEYPWLPSAIFVIALALAFIAWGIEHIAKAIRYRGRQTESNNSSEEG